MNTFKIKIRSDKLTFKKYIIHFIYGLYQLVFIFIGYIPSQLIRKLCYRCLGVKYGKDSIVHRGADIYLGHKLEIGNNSVIGPNALLDSREGIYIGNNVNIGAQVAIFTHQHDVNSRSFDVECAKVTIEDYAWISFRSIILPGVIVAQGSVIAAGAVVTKDTEPYGIYGGVPAKKIGERNRDLDYHLNSDGYIPFI